MRPSALIVKYSCVCGLERVPCPVPFRGKEEDVVYWVKHVVAPVLSEDHARRSPKCHPKSFKEVLFPLDKKSTRIGDPLK